MNIKNRYIKTCLLIIILLSFLTGAAGCTGSSSSSEPDLEATRIFKEALLSAAQSVQETAQAQAAQQSAQETQAALPTLTLTPEPTLTPTLYSGPPIELPETFTTSLISSQVTPQTYLEDTCLYLKNRWDPNKSSPGTVVMVVMYHSVAADYRELEDPAHVHHKDMVIMLEHAHETGFQTITTRELVGFLHNNAKIPSRSLLLIVDDRRPGVVKEHFMSYLEEYGWTLTLGWLIGDTDSKPASYLESFPNENFSSLWEQMESYNATDHLDVQSHGYIHNINITESSTDEFMWHELYDSRTVLQEHFYCKNYQTGEIDPNCQTDQPLAYIWPGGGFTARAAEMAHEAGYEVGFTINPRGPVMYNWVPLAAEIDPNSPSWLPEIPVGDPLMTLPRYWSYDAAYRIDEVANIGEEAAAYANQNRETELLYYQLYCKEITGEIPAFQE